MNVLRFFQVGRASTQARRLFLPLHLNIHISATSILLVALLQGILYSFLLPPWQHYDEPTHFEYAWLIANRGRLPELDDVDTTMRREVAASMKAYNFQADIPTAMLLKEGHDIWIGYSELVHPPAYYLLVSGPLRLVRYLDVASQLYIARLVSLALFVGTIAVAWAIMRELTPSDHMLRWLVPLVLALTPPFVDLMTAVNNDVGAITVFSIFLWGAIRTIRRGISLQRLIWLVAAAGIGVWTKNTASVAFVLLPLVLVIALWQHRGWPWRYLIVGPLIGFALLLTIFLRWGDPAYWYRSTTGESQRAGIRVKTADAPIYDYAFMLEPNAMHAQVLQHPLPADTIRELAGRTVTVGAWIWADQPTSVSTPSILYKDAAGVTTAATQPISATTFPRFVAQTVDIPVSVAELQVALYGTASTPEATGSRVYIDGVILVEGELPEAVPPVFKDTRGDTGTWAGRSFDNLVRNGSAESGWASVRPWVDQALIRYIRRSPMHIVAALFDLERTGPYLASTVAPFVVDGHLTGMSWGQVRLSWSGWRYIFRGIATFSVVGCLLYCYRRRYARDDTLLPALIFLGIAGGIVWLNTIFRPLPMFELNPRLPSARYALPAIVATMLVLVGGWWALWPSHYRKYAVWTMVLYMFGMNLLSIWTIWNHFYGA